MIKLFGRVAAKLTPVIAIYVVLMLSGCPAANHEGFAVYLTRGDVPPAQMPALSHIDIAEKPVIAMDDIVTYNAQTHELKLTKNAFESICKLDVPVRGKSFVICVDRKPVYWGAFWTPISSISFDGVTIWKPLNPVGPYIISLELGYPSSSFYGGEDPRNNPEVIRSLQQSGKLITGLSIAAVDKLPHSMKGYELYSWMADGQWHFTLITGTDRNKTAEEIISGADFISEAGWIQIHVAGVDAIKTVLSKLPQHEEVLWLAGLRSEQTPQGGVNITLPAEPTIDTIKEHAVQRGLDFLIQAP